MQKKVLSLILVFSLMFLSIGHIKGTYASAQGDNNTFQALVLDNIPEMAGGLDESEFTKSNLNILKSEFTNSTVILEGNLIAAGQTKEFLLTGNFYKSPSDGTVSAVLEDQKNNFEVVRFDLVENPQSSIFLNKDLSSPAFALYLKLKGSNSLVVVEESIASIMQKQLFEEILVNSKSLEQAPTKSVLWFQTIFSPDSTKEVPVNDGGSIGPLSVTQKYATKSYASTYNVFGYTTTDTITIRLEVGAPSSSAETVTAAIKVIGTKFEESNGTTLYDQTGWTVGGGSNGLLGLRLNMAQPQIVRSQGIDGVLTKSGSVKVNVSLSASYAGISAELEFNPPTVTDLNRSLTLPGGNAKTVSGFIKGGSSYLNRTGQYYSGIWNIGYDPSQGAKKNATNTVIFKYSLYNQLQNKVYNTEWNTISFTTGSV